MKKRIFTLIMILIVIFSGCSSNEVYNEENGRLIVDCSGRKVYIPKDIKSVSCMYTVTGNIIAMLGNTDKITTSSMGLLRSNLLIEMFPSIEDVTVAKVNGSINIEELLKAKTDIIFINSTMSKNKNEIKKLDKANIPYLVTDFNSINQQQYLVEMLGKIFNNEEKAREFNNFYNEIISKVSSNIKEIKEEDKVRVYHSINEATRTDGPNTFTSEWMNIAGAKSVSVDKELKMIENDYYASLEQILLWNPELILVNQEGVEDYIMTNKQWATLDAVINKKVYSLPIGISRWGHSTSIETPLAIAYASKLLYPDITTDIDVIELTKQFYMQFFNYELSDEATENILDGSDMRKPKGGN